MADPRTLPLVAAMGIGVLLAGCGSQASGRANAPSTARPATETQPARALEHDVAESPDAAPAVQRGAVSAKSERRAPEAKPCLVDVDVTAGGVVLSYAAPGAPESAGWRAVRRMVAQHNRDQTEARSDLPVSGAVRSLAMVEDVRGGSRVTLVADDALDLAELYSHLAADAPALFPAGSLEGSLCEPPPRDSTARLE